MASILIIKEKIKNPKEWYDKVMQNSAEWEYDEILKSYHVGNVYLTEKGKSQAKIVNEIFKELNLRSFGNFSKEELEQTRAIFSKLIANFSD